MPADRPLRLSVLDLSPVPSGSSSADALRNTLDLARLADRLGYTRYWLAEHHNTAGLASSERVNFLAKDPRSGSRCRFSKSSELSS